MKNVKIFFLSIGLLLCISTLSLQAQSLDSLEASLQSKLSDTVRLKVLIRVSQGYQFLDFSKSLSLSKEALLLAEKIEDPAQKAKTYQHVAYLHTLSGDFSTALKYDNLSMELNVAARDTLSLAMDYNNIGGDYYDLGEYDDAYFYLTQSYQMGTAIKDTLRMLIALHNVGRVFKELGQYDQAVNHFKLSLRLSEQYGDKEGEPYTYDEMGDVMLRRGQYDSAAYYLNQAVTMARKQNIQILQPRIYSKLATLFHKKNDYNTALSYYDSAYTMHATTSNRFGMAEAELGRSIVLTSEQKFAEALSKVEAALKTAHAINARVLEIKCYNHLSALYERKGDFQNALIYFKRYEMLEDTLFSQETQGKLLRDQIRFETEARDSQIATLSQLHGAQEDEIKKQEFIRNILVVVMALAAILLVTVYRSGQRRKKINMLLLQHQDEMEKRSEELEKLNQVKDKFFSIISHDLRSPINALAGILDLLDKGAIKPEELHIHTQELKVRFNHTRTLLNNLLDWTLLQMDKLNLQAAKINLYKLVEENIQLLLPIQGKNIKIVNSVPHDALGFADSNTINLVIRNLMTNALKFTNDGGEVLIEAKTKGFEWEISVRDNGIGMKPEVIQILFDKTAPYTTRGTANEKGTGLGLILCKEFVEKNGGKIRVDSQEGKGSQFAFTLPKAD